MARLGDYMRPSSPPRKPAPRALKADRLAPGATLTAARPAKAGHPHANLGQYLHKAKGR